MPQSKILGSNLSYSYGSSSYDSYDILLFNENNFLQISPDLGDLVSNSGLLQYAYPENREFLYLVQEYDSSGDQKSILSSEVGIGKIQKTSGNFYLKRLYATKFFDGQFVYPANGNLSKFSDTSFLGCYSYIPENYIESLIYSNSVLCSNEYNGPVGVDLPPNTVLGRTSGNIQSLDANELRAVLTDANITNAVESASGNYTFLCQTLNLANSNSRLSSAALQARPVYNTANRPTPQRGTIIYNDQTNRFEGYDGTTWRAFAWASGIGPPYI